MSGPRARFTSTTHTLRAILSGLRDTGGIEGIRSIAVNPVAEDVDPDGDRIHAIMQDGEVSETAIVAEAGRIVLEKVSGVAVYYTWDIDLAVVAFLSSLRHELKGPVVEKAREAAPVAPSATDRAVILPEPRREEGPKARFRSTAVMVALLRGEGHEVAVNALPEMVEDEEDVIHVRRDDGEFSGAFIVCGPRSFGYGEGEVVIDYLPMREAADAFIERLGNEMAPGPRF